MKELKEWPRPENPRLCGLLSKFVLVRVPAQEYHRLSPRWIGCSVENVPTNVCDADVDDEPSQFLKVCCYWGVSKFVGSLSIP